MLRGVWRALNCLSIDATYCVIVAGSSPGETKMWAARYVKTAIICTCGSNNWESVEDRWVHARRVWQELNCLFIHATFYVIATGASPRQTKNEGGGT